MHNESTSRKFYNLNNRLGHVENSIASITSSMTALGNNVNEIGQSLKSLINNFNTSSRTNWATVAAWAAVIVTVVCSFLYMAARPYDVVLSSIQRQESEVMIKIEQLEKQLHRQEIKIAILGVKDGNH